MIIDYDNDELIEKKMNGDRTEFPGETHPGQVKHARQLAEAVKAKEAAAAATREQTTPETPPIGPNPEEIEASFNPLEKGPPWYKARHGVQLGEDFRRRKEAIQKRAQTPQNKLTPK